MAFKIYNFGDGQEVPTIELTCGDIGIGTTEVAAKNLNRSLIGIEMDPDYFNIALERIESA
jgi:tRNA G46 methylase TrmB